MKNARESFIKNWPGSTPAKFKCTTGDRRGNNGCWNCLCKHLPNHHKDKIHASLMSL